MFIFYKIISLWTHYKFCFHITALTAITITVPDILFATALLKFLTTAAGSFGVAYKIYKESKKPKGEF